MDKKNIIPFIIMMIVCTQLNMLTASAQPLKFAIKTVKNIEQEMIRSEDTYFRAATRGRLRTRAEAEDALNNSKALRRIRIKWHDEWEEIEEKYPDADIDVNKLEKDFQPSFAFGSSVESVEKSAYSYILREK